MRVIFEAAGHGTQFEIDHYVAGLGASVTALASLLAAIAALGFTKKDTKKTAVDECDKRIDALLKGVEIGARRNA
jgi:hypothetical protein